MKLRYIGPFDAIEIPDLGLDEVKRRGTFDAPAEAAALLLEQADNYERVAPPKKRTAVKKAATPAAPKVKE